MTRKDYLGTGTLPHQSAASGVVAFAFPGVPAHMAVQFAAVVFPYFVPDAASRITKHELELERRAAENCVVFDATLVEPPPPVPLSQATVPLATERVAATT
jgi:hypothetical protein